MMVSIIHVNIVITKTNKKEDYINTIENTMLNKGNKHMHVMTVSTHQQTKLVLGTTEDKDMGARNISARSVITHTFFQAK